MNKLRILSKMLLTLGMCWALGSCSGDEPFAQDQAQQPSHPASQHLTMNLVGNISRYHQGNKLKAAAESSTTWTENDTIYITFKKGTSTVAGVATYKAGKWDVEVDGYLDSGTNLECTAHYFVNATTTEKFRVDINPNTEIYEDNSGTYNYTNGDLTVYANLTPKTGRIRFKGNQGNDVHLLGITTYTTFAPTSNTFTTQSTALTETVNNQGTTPYIYGYFTDDSRTLSVAYGEVGFTRNCTASILKAGESGYMDLPTEASHSGWRSGFTIRVNRADYKMLPVVGCTGGYFMMGETEVTDFFYGKIINSGNYTSQYPMTWSYGSRAITFAQKVANLTQLNISLPTRAQWQFAAKGGLKSHGYTYAGSNTADDVAWYSGNSGSAHNVKLKMANELGLYDMSGNAGEWTCDKYDNNDNYWFCGGKCNDDETKITVTSSTWGSSSYSRLENIGARLILTFPTSATE